MIPISDNIFIFNRKQPLAVYLIIGLNVALFLWEIQLNLSENLANVINNWGLIPAQISIAFTAASTGNPAAGVVVFWRLISLLGCLFLHGSWSQILGNMIFLWVFGKTLENVLGHGKFLLFYIFCGILTGFAQVIADPLLAVPLIGANGAIASILGAYALKFLHAKIDTVLPLIIIYIPIELPTVFYLFWWFGQQLFYGIGSLNIPGGVNSNSTGYWAHGVGLIIGAGVMKIWQRR